MLVIIWILITVLIRQLLISLSFNEARTPFIKIWNADQTQTGMSAVNAATNMNKAQGIVFSK